MQIKKIEISNFRLFSEELFEFDSRFNLIVGVNGSGKTSLLRAIAVAMGGWAHAYIENEKNHRPISDQEMREVQIDHRFDRSKKTEIKASGEAQIVDRTLNEKIGKVSWVRTREEGSKVTNLTGHIQYGGYSFNYPLTFKNLGKDALKYIEAGNKFNFPLLAFYACDRIWLSTEDVSPEKSAKQQYSRFDAYIDCFHTGANHTQLGEWLLKNEMASIQKKQDTPVLQSIRNAAKSAIAGCTGLRFDFEEGRVLVEFDSKSIPFDHLSDGQRTVLGLFCDIARRAAILNPHLEGRASDETSGIVLIDELDLHLHPKWQRTIVKNLKSCFPKIQFICTTHSPFIIQSIFELNAGKLIPLGEVNQIDGRPSIEDIAENIQGIEMPSRSQRFQEMLAAAKDYYKLLKTKPENNKDIELIKNKLDELMLPFSDDPAYQAILSVERELHLGARES